MRERRAAPLDEPLSSIGSRKDTYSHPYLRPVTAKSVLPEADRWSVWAATANRDAAAQGCTLLSQVLRSRPRKCRTLRVSGTNEVCLLLRPASTIMPRLLRIGTKRTRERNTLRWRVIDVLRSTNPVRGDAALNPVLKRVLDLQNVGAWSALTMLETGSQEKSVELPCRLCNLHGSGLLVQALCLMG